jgi:tetratricopeptide (TPR) repeat protein
MNSRKPVSTISIIIILVALAVVVFFMFKSKNQQESSTTNQNNNSQTSDKSSDSTNSLQDQTKKPATNIELAKRYYEQKNYSKALDYYLLVLGKDKNNLEAIVGAGNCYQELKNSEKAIEYYTKVVSLDKKNITAYLNLSTLYKNNGNTTKAKEVLETGLKNNPNNEDLQNSLDIIDITGNNASN